MTLTAGSPALPRRGARGQRNIIVREYWRIDPDIIWATIVNDLPQLAADIGALPSVSDER